MCFLLKQPFLFNSSSAYNEIQRGGVQYILHTVIEELRNNPNRTFVWVEMAFFVRWWNEQDYSTKDIVSHAHLLCLRHLLMFNKSGYFF